MTVNILSDRAETILKSIISDYIVHGVPVPSQSLANNPKLRVSSATIRNEMARLEEAGYITRPHTSAGSVPLDKGYRYYVESLGEVALPSSEQILINHLFHQVEHELDAWVRLAGTLMAQLVQNIAIVTTPKPTNSRFKHLELVGIRDSMALAVLIFIGARLKEQLIMFGRAVPQPTLTALSNRLNELYNGLTRPEIEGKDSELSPMEKQITACLLKMMQEQDEQEYEEPYLDGLHFILSQPEFARSTNLLSLLELMEGRSLLSAILPRQLSRQRVQVVIGQENNADAVKNCSVVISQYGSGEAVGTIGVIGPTRMPYDRAISAVSYMASVLNDLIAELYGGIPDPKN